MTPLRTSLVIISAFALLVTTGCNSLFDEGEPSAEADYNQTEVIPVLEEAIEDSIAGISDFPGFYERNWGESSCTGGMKGQETYDEFVEIRVTYYLDDEYFDDGETAEAYADILRDHWVDLDFEITQDRNDGTGAFSTLAAKRDDGVTVSFRGVGRLSFNAYVGCVERTDEWNFVEPLGEVEPENDNAQQHQ